MSMIPSGVWHNIAKWLKPIDLRAFLKTIKDAKHSLPSAQREDIESRGSILLEYDKIFAQYGWVERVAFLGLTPILIYRDKERSYVDLWLADQKQPRVPGTCISRKFGGNEFQFASKRARSTELPEKIPNFYP
ncbi:uncharacterized protein FFNC_15661 [Fusarium fujikuroi]|nr:uncharacterized protein FFNC_15661 [Fusarium fujikuroi]